MFQGKIWGHGTASSHTDIKSLTITIHNDTTKATMTQELVCACTMIFNTSTKSYDKYYWYNIQEEKNTSYKLDWIRNFHEADHDMKTVTTPNRFCYSTYNLVLEDKWDSQLKMLMKEAETCKKREMRNLWVGSAICWAPTQQGRDEREEKHLHRQTLRCQACFLDLVFFAGCHCVAANVL